MIVVRPVSVSADQVVSSTAVESEPVYNPAENYPIGEQVVFGKSIYESLQNPNVGNQPDLSASFWLEVGPSSEWAMFDSSVSTTSKAPSALNVVFRPGKIVDSLSLIGIAGATMVDVKMRDYGQDPPVEVYSQSVGLDASIVTDWYEYFFAEFDLRDQVILTDLPPYLFGEIEVSLSVAEGSSDICEVGLLQVGNLFEVGSTGLGVGVGIRDYSIKEIDDRGNSRFVEGLFSRRMNPLVFVDNDRLNSIYKVLSAIRAKPTVFISSVDPAYGLLVVFGFLADWNIEVKYPQYSLISMDIKGLT